MPPNNITFESDNNNFKYKSRVILSTVEVPVMTKFLVDKGIVKNEKQANILELVVVISFLLISTYIVYNTFFNQKIGLIYTPEEKALLDSGLNKTQQ